MSRWHGATGLLALVLGLGLLGPVAEGAGAPRISNLAVVNSGQALVVSAVLLGALPDGVLESLATGIPATVRFQLELWQYNSWWVDRRIVAKLVERQVVYDVLTKEYRVLAIQGEEREPYVTRDIWEAERVLSQLRGLTLSGTAALRPEDLYYVRARVEIRSGAPDPSFSKLIPFVSSRVETGWEQSPLLTLRRTR
jgi:hypothetical protein